MHRCSFYYPSCMVAATPASLLQPGGLTCVSTTGQDQTGEPVMKSRRYLELLVVMGGIAATAYGQSVISARSGVIHYSEGKVFLADKLVEPKFGEFPEMKPGTVLRSEEGRV